MVPDEHYSVHVNRATLARLLHNRTLIYGLVFVVAAFLGTKRIIRESGDIGIYLQAAQELFEGHGDLYGEHSCTWGWWA